MDVLDNLTAIGLTEYEARVYLALLRESPTNGYQLSKKTGVPRSMVYEALGRLHARGAVLKSGDAKTTLYQPVPPDLLLDRYQREQQHLIDNLRVHLQTWYSERNEDLLWSIAGKGPVFTYANQMISEAKEEIFLVLNDLALEQVRSTLQVTCEKSIYVGVLLTGSGKLRCDHLAYHPPLESELQGLENLLLITADGKQCLIASLEEEASATITNNRKLIFIARQFVWMELFTQRIYKRLGSELLARLEEGDRRIFDSYTEAG